MPAKTLKRVQVGVTNKSSSQSKLNGSSHGASCVCKTCNCGQHVCSEKHKSGESSIPNSRNIALTGESETTEQYRQIKDAGPRVLVKKVYDLPPKRDLVGVSEQKTQFIAKPTPARPQPHIVKYEPNLNKLEGESESHEVYHAWPATAPPQRNKKQVYVANTNKIDDSTETNTQYSVKAMPVPYPKHENKYVANPNKLEGASENKESYKGYPAGPAPTRYKKQTAVLKNEKLEGTSVSHDDYQEPEEQERAMPIKKSSEYKPPTGPIDARSLYADQFQPYFNTERPVQKEREQFVSQKEDRDFSSTTRASYPQYGAHQMNKKVETKHSYVPNKNLLEGSSTTHQDYKEVNVSQVMQGRKDIKKAALQDRHGTFHLSNAADKLQEDTEYFLSYEADTITGDHRVQPIKPVVQSAVAGPGVRLEGESEIKSSYRKPAEVSSAGMHVYDKMKDFKPAAAGKFTKDDRNFISVTRDAFQPHQCPATQIHNVQRSAVDGHLYAVEQTLA